MGQYIGSVYLPYVSEFSVDKAEKEIEVVKHLGTTPHHVAEFRSGVKKLVTNGTLMQASGTVKTAEQYAEDIMGLEDSMAPFNFVYNYQGRTGWAAVRLADAPEIAETPLIRKYTIGGLFMPKAKYQPRRHTAPTIRSNPWSHVLGTDDCDNYVAIPIGATYSGGDGSTITRVGEDGTITLVLATTANDIRFDVTEDDIDNGEVKIWDELGEASESDWIKVFDVDHEFTGKAVIQNSIYRVILDPATEYITVYRYDSGWTKIDDFTAGTFDYVQLTTANDDEVILKLSSGVEITMARGHPALIDTSLVDLLAVALTPADQSTSTDNYLVLATSTYICSDANFSIVNSTKNLDSGKKWIFYETNAATAEDIAHQALVLQNGVRELVAR